MTRSGLRSPKHCRHHLGGERGSMAILMMVVLVGMMLSALIVPMVITQDRTTRFDGTRVQALNAAQAGIDVVLGEIRASVSSDGVGVASKLPCGTQTGVVNSTGIASYTVVVEYFRFDPVTSNYPYPGLDNQLMKCISGYGTYDVLSNIVTPGFARFTSVGKVGTPTNGSTAGRTLTSTYVFRTSNINIPGGLVKIFPASTGLCMDVGSPTAPSGTPVKLQSCSTTTPPAAQQVFAYRTDLTLQLASSVTSFPPNGLCLDSLHTPAASGDAVQLKGCGPMGTPVYTQQWSYNDNGQYEAAKSTSATDGVLAALCLSAASQSAGQAVTVGTCSLQWVPLPSVGPGAAALPQWINFFEFGRCLDVTDAQPNKTYLIDYPCKQNPYPAAVRWNQKFQAPTFAAGQPSVTAQITTNDGSYWCLTSPGSIGAYVTVKTCVGNRSQLSTWAQTQTWTLYGGDSSLNYSTKYTIVSGPVGNQLCLGLSSPNSEHPDWSTIDVETCNGSTEQKWNAVPSVLIAALKNFHE